MSIALVKNLIPHFIQEQMLSGKQNDCLEGYAIFVDLSGFTRLTETLLKKGKTGAERLSGILNAIFEPMVSLVYEQGGFIPHFAGDAFFGIFPNDRTSLDGLQVLSIAIQHFKLLEEASSAFREFDIGIKIGISYGEIGWGIVGKERKNYYFREPAILGCAKSQEYANSHEVIVDEAFVNQVGSKEGFIALETAGFYKVDKDFRTWEFPAPKKQRKVKNELSLEVLSQFLPESVIQFNQKGEFRTVVTVFISFEGLENHASLNEFSSIILEQASNFAGYFKEMEFADKGGVMVVIFGAPVSYENNTDRALEFVCAISEELIPLQHDGKVQFKVGAATGIAYTGIVGGEERCQYAAVGNRVNIAARLMMNANWGEVLVDEEVNKNPHFRFEHKGDITYKGLQDSIPTYRLNGRNVEYRQVFTGVMVGRSAEMNLLENMAIKAFENANPAIVYIYGEAGIGKTRLSFELQNRLRHKKRLRWLSCQSDQILQKPFNPFIFLLKNYFGQSSDNSTAVNLENFERRFSNLVDEVMYVEHPEAERIKREVIRTKPVMAALTGLATSNSLWDNLDARGRYENTLAALTNLFLAEALRKPVVIEIEDGHWYDSSSKAFLNEFVSRAKGFPIFFVITSRYDDEGNKPKVFNEKLLERNGIQVREIDLNILDGQALQEFARERLQGNINPDLYELLLRTTNGNPFYAEQILEYFLESDQLIKVDNNWSVRDKNVRISDSIQTILTARIDRLSAIVKETIKAAAVIGREFELPVLSEVMKGSEAFSTTTEKNSAQLFLKEQVKTAEKAQIWQAVNELRYIFRHALLRETIYDMQLKTRLRELHRLIAEAIENLYKNHLEQHYVDLVFHYEQAQVEPKIKEYLLKAADHSKAYYQNKQAVHYYDRLLSILQKEKIAGKEASVQKARILLKKGSIHELTGEWEECENIYRKALVLSKDSEDSNLLGTANNRLGYLLMLKGEYDEADRLLETAAAFFGSIHDNKGTSKVYGNLGTLYFRQGKYEDAKLYFIRSIQLSQLYKHTPSNAQIVATLGLTYMNLGKYEDGIRWQQSQLDLCKKVNDKQGMATLYVNMGIVYSEKGDYDEALKCYQQGLELSEELGNKQLTAIAIGSIGNVWQQKGNFDLAMQNFQYDLELTEELGDKQGISIALGLIGELYSIMGEFDKAIEHMERNLSISIELGYQKGYAKALNNLGDIYFFKNDLNTSLDYYDRCIMVTRSIGNKLVLGLSLAEKGQVLLAQGKIDKAEKNFTEALKVAKELNHPDLLFESKLLQAKLEMTSGKGEKAKATLLEMLSEVNNEKDKAAVYYELSKTEDSGTYRKQALSIYENLYRQTPMHLFRLRIKELEAVS